MTPQELVDKTAVQCDLFRIFIQKQTTHLADLGRRLKQIVQQLRKNIEVRDTDFAGDFNQFVQEFRDTLDKRDPVWIELRGQIRQIPSKLWTGELALSAKGLNSRAKAMSQSYNEFEEEYSKFCKNYKSFTAAKLNVWLLTSCQTDVANLTGKIVFIAREISRKTTQHRSPYAK